MIRAKPILTRIISLLYLKWRLLLEIFAKCQIILNIYSWVKTHWWTIYRTILEWSLPLKGMQILNVWSYTTAFAELNKVALIFSIVGFLCWSIVVVIIILLVPIVSKKYISLFKKFSYCCYSFRKILVFLTYFIKIWRCMLSPLFYIILFLYSSSACPWKSMKCSKWYFRGLL